MDTWSTNTTDAADRSIVIDALGTCALEALAGVSAGL